MVVQRYARRLCQTGAEPALPAPSRYGHRRHQHGDNGSVNSHYSGTMGVTREGCMKYIPSVAFSLCDYRDDADFEPLRSSSERLQPRCWPKVCQRTCLNVNFPKTAEFKGVKVCRMAKVHGEMRLFAPVIPGVTTIIGLWANIPMTNLRQPTPTTGLSTMVMWL